MTVTTCEHFGRMCPGHHCTCKCDACQAAAVKDIVKNQNRRMKDAEKEGRKKGRK